jgi:Skp family chaperone for outer membrane proteins
MNPDTPRTDAIEFRHCPPQPKELLKKHQDAYALSRELERELNASQAEVARLRDELERSKEMVMDAARRGDMMASHWKERAEKAEALVKQIHHYAGIIEGFQTTTEK